MDTIEQKVTQIPMEVQKVQLPPLIKQPTTYKLIVPAKVERKIRYLQKKFPSTEWSGVLFTKHTGNFEDNNLVITCEDIYPMDLGNSTYTEYKMDETVASYMAENIELFECDLNLIHSHHSMSAFFSGTDTATLRSEGNDTNCFVSLIVNNAGTYCAAVTRKVQKKKEITVKDLGSSYQFFGEGEWTLDPANGQITEKTVDETVIEYFMLDVEVEKVENPLDYLDVRFEEIEAKKKAVSTGFTRVYDPKKGDTLLVSPRKFGNDYDEDKDFFDWIHQNKKKEPEQPSLFSEEEMGEIDIAKWQPDPTIIHKLVTQMITCSLIVGDIDLKQWITRHMIKKYDEIFEGDEFDVWADSSVDFLLSHYSDPELPAEVYDDYDSYLSRIAEAMIDELTEYPSNAYIEQYSVLLSRRLI